MFLNNVFYIHPLSVKSPTLYLWEREVSKKVHYGINSRVQRSSDMNDISRIAHEMTKHQG